MSNETAHRLPSLAGSNLSPRQHLRKALAWLAEMLEQQVERVVRRGRAPMGAPLAGVMIEDSEAAGLIGELKKVWGNGQERERKESHQPGSESHRPRGWTPSDVERLPLLRALSRFDLDLLEYIALLMGIAVEVDGRFGRLIAYLNDHAGRTRPTLGLAMAMSGDEEGTMPVALLARRCVRDGLIELEGEGPIPDLSLRVATQMLARFTGEETDDTALSTSSFAPARRGALGKLVLRESFRHELEHWLAKSRQSQPFPLTLVVGEKGSGRRTIAHALVSELGRGLVWGDAGPDSLSKVACLLRREARWNQAAMMLRLASPLTEATAAALKGELSGVDAPVFVAVESNDIELVSARMGGVPVVELPRLELAERSALWAALAPAETEVSADAAGRLAARFRFNPGKIQRAARRASAQSAVRPRVAVAADDLAEAARSLARGALDGLAQRLELPYTRDQLVVSEHIAQELSLAMAWITHRKQVMDDWGLGRRIRMGRGLTMLLCGPPGTGKTMAAQVMARELGMDLFRLDLPSVMSKYIGETEQHLKKLIGGCEEAGVALLVDECEVLLSKRAEVRDARDKYANAEVGALLVMLEDFEGVSFLATNRGGDMDEAFVRRFPFIISFAPPDEAERRRIWQGLLPKDVLESGTVNVGELARTYKLTGGEIKNAVLAGAYAAAKEGRTISQEHLLAAVKREGMKSGKNYCGAVRS